MAEPIKKHGFIFAVATLIGMIVGAGTFGIPYVMAQAGFFVGLLYLFGLGLAVMLVHLFYGEIILRTSEPHLLVGYANKYLGSAMKKVAMAVIVFEYYGSLLAYIILGGEFLNIIFGRWLVGGDAFWALVFFIFGAVVIFRGIKTVARDELIMMGLLVLTVAILFARGFGLITLGNFPAPELGKFFLPYGVILFALTGSAAIPELRRILAGRENKLKSAIILGTAIPVLIYLFFAFVVVGITGAGTSPEAIRGLIPYLGNWVVTLGAVFGILAVYTSFIILGLCMRDIFWRDYRMKKFWAFLLTVIVPLAAYWFGLKSFILIIGLIGALASGLDGILTILIYLRAKKMGDRQPEYSLPLARLLGAALVLLLGLGVVYQLVYLAK